MDTEELLVHDSRQREGAERVHACFVDALGVLSFTYQWTYGQSAKALLLRENFTFKLEGEVIRQMSTLVITTKQEECVGVPNLERPQVEYTL